jgi:hypothetical protein
MQAFAVTARQSEQKAKRHLNGLWRPFDIITRLLQTFLLHSKSRRGYRFATFGPAGRFCKMPNTLQGFRRSFPAQEFRNIIGAHGPWSDRTTNRLDFLSGSRCDPELALVDASPTEDRRAGWQALQLANIHDFACHDDLPCASCSFCPAGQAVRWQTDDPPSTPRRYSARIC